MYTNTNSYKYQSSLANYCKTGNYTPIPGVIEKNIGRYRELIYNIFDDSLSSAFPLTKNLLQPNEWDEMVHDFMKSHQCSSPMVWQMPGEFYQFAVESEYKLIREYPFLFDLLLFEWEEVDVYMMEDIAPFPYADAPESKTRYVANPELKILQLQYPVHLKNATTISENDKGVYFVTLHREPETGKVLFTNIGLPHAQLIEKLQAQPAGFIELLSIFTEYAPQKQAEEALVAFINASLDSKLILGYANTEFS
ncbi:MAG TPA: putative DNA-binding domain-containing protein [Prolixibacteraceae bacterium]|nr:putative DNA-binding domain-containing protein [Prolixibacteraceae bacterium]